MGLNEKLYWQIIFIIVLLLFGSTIFFFMDQIPRYGSSILPHQSMNTNIAVFLLFISFGLVLYYLLKRQEISVFFEERMTAHEVIASHPEKLGGYHRLHHSITMDLPQDQIPDRRDLVRKGNMYLKLWVLCGIVVIFLSYFLLTLNSAWVYDNRYWILIGGAIVFAVFFLIEDFYHENAAGLYGWTPASDNEILYRHVSPLMIVTGTTVFALLLFEWAVFQYLIPPYSQNDFLVFNPQNPSLYFQFMPVVVCVALGIVFYLFRLRE